MSSTEIQGWKDFFTIYPFTEDREDLRAALVAQTIANTSGLVKKPVELEVFLPDYLGERKVVEKSLEQQEKDRAAFLEKYHRVRREAGLE